MRCVLLWEGDGTVPSLKHTNDCSQNISSKSGSHFYLGKFSLTTYYQKLSQSTFLASHLSEGSKKTNCKKQQYFVVS